MASFFKRMFTRKANNKPKNNRSANNKAAYQAEWEVRSKYGRGAHSRVANVLRPNEGPHNYVAKEKQRLEAYYKKIYASKLATITPSHKQGLIDIGKQIQEKLGAAAAAGGGGSDSDSINISIPRVLGKVLLFAIGLALLALALGAIFIDLALASNGSGGPGVSSLMFMQSASFMGLGRPPPVFNDAAEE